MAERNYRILYVKITGIPIPRWWHVHHLDGNHENNDIENLVAIPPDIHVGIHKYDYLKDKTISMTPIGNAMSGNNYNASLFFAFEQFMYYYVAVQRMIDYRDYLRGMDVEPEFDDYELLNQKYNG